MYHVETPSWLMDSVATHHITSDLANLSMHVPYTGAEEVLIGDGSGLKITHTGYSLLPLSSCPLTLKNVLRVPKIYKYLVYVKRLCTNNGLFIEFFLNDFQVKDLNTGTPLIMENNKDGRYEWPSHSSSMPSDYFSSIKYPFSI